MSSLCSYWPLFRWYMTRKKVNLILSFGIKSICAELHNFWKCQSQFGILPKQIHEMRSNLSSFDPFLEFSQTISRCTRKKEKKKTRTTKKTNETITKKLQLPGHASYSGLERSNLILLFRALLSTTIKWKMFFLNRQVFEQHLSVAGNLKI